MLSYLRRPGLQKLQQQRSQQLRLLLNSSLAVLALVAVVTADRSSKVVLQSHTEFKGHTHNALSNCAPHMRDGAPQN